jgi:hypothetical protein
MLRFHLEIIGLKVMDLPGNERAWKEQIRFTAALRSLISACSHLSPEHRNWRPLDCYPPIIMMMK